MPNYKLANRYRNACFQLAMSSIEQEDERKILFNKERNLRRRLKKTLKLKICKICGKINLGDCSHLPFFSVSDREIAAEDYSVGTVVVCPDCLSTRKEEEVR